MQIGQYEDDGLLLFQVLAEAKLNAFHVLESEMDRGNMFGAGYAAVKVVRVMRLYHAIMGDPFPSEEGKVEA